MFIDAFEAMILPRRVSHAFRPASFFYRSTWRIWRTAAHGLPVGKRRHGFLSVFGPLSLLGLAGVWALGLMLGFAGLQWSAGSHLEPPRATERPFCYPGGCYSGRSVPVRADSRASSSPRSTSLLLNRMASR